MNMYMLMRILYVDCPQTILLYVYAYMLMRVCLCVYAYACMLMCVCLCVYSTHLIIRTPLIRAYANTNSNAA